MNKDSRYKIFNKEHIIGVIIWVLPLMVVWVVFGNDEVQYVSWLKNCGSLASGVSVFVAFTAIFTKFVMRIGMIVSVQAG